MATAYLPPKRVAFFEDIDGVLSLAQDVDEVQPHTIDWSDTLNSGETISSATITGSGVTVSGASNTTTTTTVTVTGSGGDVKHAVVTSSSRTLVRYVHIYAPGRRERAYAR